jgi:hypothetical protein
MRHTVNSLSTRPLKSNKSGQILLSNALLPFCAFPCLQHVLSSIFRQVALALLLLGAFPACSTCCPAFTDSVYRRVAPLLLLLCPFPCLQHVLSSMYLPLVNQKFPEDHLDQLQVQADAITQL